MRKTENFFSAQLSGDIRSGHAGKFYAFSLTPALSRWERENYLLLQETTTAGACTGGMWKRLDARKLFPSPSGRGIKGEGERDVHPA